jgi:TatA/E family protein of Tat protein translocase
MFDIGLQEMLVIGVLALLVFGPSKLPELGRMFGRAMREFRRASDEFRSTVESNLHINDPDPGPPPPADAVTSTPAPDLAAGPDAASDRLSSELEPAGAFETVLANEPHPEPFCARRGSRLFHRRECEWVARIPEVDRVYIKEVSDGRDQGFVTCPVCEPWQPA